MEKKKLPKLIGSSWSKFDKNKKILNIYYTKEILCMSVKPKIYKLVNKSISKIPIINNTVS